MNSQERKEPRKGVVICSHLFSNPHPKKEVISSHLLLILVPSLTRDQEEVCFTFSRYHVLWSHIEGDANNPRFYSYALYSMDCTLWPVSSKISNPIAIHVLPSSHATSPNTGQSGTGRSRYGTVRY